MAVIDESSTLIRENQLPRRPSNAAELEYVDHVGLKEWTEVEDLAKSRGEVGVPDDIDSEYNILGFKFAFSWATLWAYAGPGWLMSIAFVDPGNLESDLQAGAYGGYQLIWVLLGATIMGFFLQVLSARLGVVTGKNLAEMCHLMYPRWTSRVLWFMAEVAIVGSDIQEVLGSAIALQILFKLPLWIGCLVTAVDTYGHICMYSEWCGLRFWFTFLLLHHFGVRKLEAFFMALVAVMLVCFCTNAIQGNPDATQVLQGFVPSIPKRYATTQAVGILGAVIMPYNLFLHSGLVQSRSVDRQDGRKLAQANKYFAIEGAVALFVSFLINLAVVCVFAQSFFSLDCLPSFDIHGINTACLPLGASDSLIYGRCDLAGTTGVCQEIGLSGAGIALRGVLNSYSETIWAVGLLAAGQSSTMAGTYAGQFVMEGFLSIRLPPWKRMALTRAVALVPALSVAMWSESRPSESDSMNEFLNVLQSVQLPFALIPILHFTSNPVVMGTFANGRTMRLIGWAMTLVVCFVNIYLVVDKVPLAALAPLAQTATVGGGLAYFAFLTYLVALEVKRLVAEK
ncbi:hypothetical protein DYB31_008225 [Aphanomyces astaci]|uniref:Uncharacterized protein n=1 Tax=Aphanomyces astaci TaxID=112090 RepID=A0A397EIR5_APHAT|nr:hypothetical protein DYB31_008225 [Aphanomyces astaci]